MFRLYSKLKRLKSALKSFNTKKFSKISEMVHLVKEELTNIQVTLQNQGVIDELRRKEVDCKMRYITLCKQDEAFYMQKSRVLWLSKGDRNPA